MKVYVDELPKSCWECPCFRNDLEQGCGLDDEGKDYFLDDIDGGECPLKSLTEHDKQVINGIRKQVQDQIIICGAKATEQDFIEANSYNTCISDIIDILDQMQGENNKNKLVNIIEFAKLETLLQKLSKLDKIQGSEE